MNPNNDSGMTEEDFLLLKAFDRYVKIVLLYSHITERFGFDTLKVLQEKTCQQITALSK